MPATGRDAARDGDRFAVAFLIGLRPADDDLEAVLGFLEVGNVERAAVARRCVSLAGGC
jgi:hypothetical protein